MVPCTREATLVHFIDNLGGNLGSFDRIEKALAEGARWSDFDRGLATAAYFGGARAGRLGCATAITLGRCGQAGPSPPRARGALALRRSCASTSRAAQAPADARLFGANKTVRGALAMSGGTLAATLALHRVRAYRERLPASCAPPGRCATAPCSARRSCSASCPTAPSSGGWGSRPGERAASPRTPLAIHDQADFVLVAWPLLAPALAHVGARAGEAFAVVAGVHLAVNLVGYALGARTAAI